MRIANTNKAVNNQLIDFTLIPYIVERSFASVSEKMGTILDLCIVTIPMILSPVYFNGSLRVATPRPLLRLGTAIDSLSEGTDSE